MLFPYTHYHAHSVARKIVLRFFNPQPFSRILILTVLVSLGISGILPAYCQIDGSYGKNTSGLRLGAGGGITQLNSRYDDNPWVRCFIGTLDYEFNPYFSIGIEGQIGTLQGIDNGNPPTQHYYMSSNDYKSINFNLKFGLGLVSDIQPENGFQNAISRLYLGVGGGVMQSNITFSESSAVPLTYYDPNPYHYSPVLSVSTGTFIDIGNILGYDKVEINPNYQFTYIKTPYGDGFKSTADSSLKTFYSLLSLTVKLKF